MWRRNCWVARMQGLARLYLGEFVAARAILERCMGLADPAYRAIGRNSLSIPTLAMLLYLALTLAYLGYIDQARLRMDEALSEARRVKHAHTLAHVLILASWLDWLTCSPMMHVEEACGSDD